MRRRLAFGTVLLLVLAMFSGCVAVSTGGPVISDARSRACVAGDMCGIYMNIANIGSQEDTLIGAKTDVAMSASLHTVIPDPNGGMMMEEIENIPVPAAGVVELKPGSLHIMVMDLKQDLKPGDTFPMTLIFEQAGERPVQITVMAEE